MQLRLLLALIIAHGVLSDDDSSFLQLSDASKDSVRAEDSIKHLSPNEKARRKRARELKKSPQEKEIEKRHAKEKRQEQERKEAAERAEAAAERKKSTGLGATPEELTKMYDSLNETVSSKVSEYAKLRRNLQFLNKSIEQLDETVDHKSAELTEHLDLVEKGMKTIAGLDARSNELKLSIQDTQGDIDLVDANGRKFNMQKVEGEIENAGVILRSVTEEIDSQRARLEEQENDVKEQVASDSTVRSTVVSNQQMLAHLNTVVSGMSRNSKVLTDLRTVLADEVENTEAEYQDMTEKERVEASDKLTTLMRRAVGMQKTVLQKAYVEVIDAAQQQSSELVQMESAVRSTLHQRKAELSNELPTEVLDPVVDSVIRNLHANQGMRKHINERRTALEKRLAEQNEVKAAQVASLEKEVESLQAERDQLAKSLSPETKASLLQLESNSEWPRKHKKLNRQTYVKLVSKKDQIEKLMEASLKDEQDLLARRSEKESAIAAIELKIKETVALFKKLSAVAEDGQWVINRQENEKAKALETLASLKKDQSELPMLRADTTAMEEVEHLATQRHQLNSLQDDIKVKNQELQELVTKHLFAVSTSYQDQVKDKYVGESAEELNNARQALRQVFDDSWKAVTDLDTELVKMRSLRMKLVGNNDVGSDDLVRDLADLKSMVNTETANLDKLDQQVATQKEDLDKSRAQLAALQQGPSAGVVQASSRAIENAIFAGPKAAKSVNTVELSQLSPTIKADDEELQKLESDADQRDNFFAEQQEKLSKKAKSLQSEIHDLGEKAEDAEFKRQQALAQPSILRDNEGSFLD